MLKCYILTASASTARDPNAKSANSAMNAQTAHSTNAAASRHAVERKCQK